jgi:hypothetical protein
VRTCLFALALLSCLGCICFAIAQEQALRGPGCARSLHPGCVAPAAMNASNLRADDSGPGGYLPPPAIDDPDDPGDN